MSTTAERQPIDPRFAEMLEILHAGGTFSYWWNRDPKTERKSTEWWAIDKRTNPTNGVVDAYYGIHPTVDIPPTNARGDIAPPEHVRSQIKYIASVNTLFGEFDAKRFDGGKQEALAHILSLPATPSSIVDSGGGYHVYWFLNRTWTLETEEDRKRACDIQYRWVQFINSDDDAKDLARVLRVPGTHNLKYDHKPVVEFVKFDASIQYDLDELVSLLPVAEVAQPRPPTAARVDIADKRLAAYVDKVYRDEIAGVVLTNDGKHKNLLEAANAIGSILHYGISEDEAFNALHDAVVGKAKDIKNADQTIRDGLKFGQANQRDLSEKLAPAQPAFNDAGMPLCVQCGAVMFRAKSKDVWGCKTCIDAGTPFWWEGNGYAPTPVVAPEKPAQTATEATPARKPKLIHGDDMDKTLQPTEWLVPGMIPKGKLIENFGMGGSGKSLLNLDLALTIAHFGNVIYVAAEDENEYNPRKKAWEQHHKTRAPGFYFWPEPISLLTPESVDDFLAEALNVAPILIVIDPLANCMAGYNDSDTKDMMMAVESLNRIRKATGATILVCHHTGWSDTHERGSSVLRWACRMVMKTTNHEEFVSLSCEKVNGFKKFDTRYFNMVETEFAPVMVPTEQMTDKGNRITSKHIAVLDAMSLLIFRDGATFTQIFEHLQNQQQYAKSTLNNALSKLMELNAIDKRGNGRNNVTYHTTDRGAQILERHKAGLNPSFSHTASDNVRGFNWQVQSSSEPSSNQDRTNFELQPELGSGFRDIDMGSSSVPIPDTDAVVRASSVSSSVLVQPYCSSSFDPASLEAGDDELRTEQTTRTPAHEFSMDFVRKCVDAGDVTGVQNHCRMYGRSFESVMDEIIGDDNVSSD